MPHTPSLTTKLLAMGVGFLLVALSSIGITLWVTWKIEGGAAAVNEAGRLRMLVLRTSLAQDPVQQQAMSARFDAALVLLRQGDPVRPLFVPWTDTTRAQFAAAQQAWQALLPVLRDPELGTQRSEALVQLLDAFVDAIEAELARWTAALHLFQLGMVGLAIAVAVAFMAMSYWLVLNPVARLKSALERVRQGRLDTRLTVEADDEFGQLEAGFNLMAQALQSARDDLELKVHEKTAKLETQHTRLQALYAVSAQVAEASSLQALAQGFVQLVRAAAGADAAAVRWSDEANERYVLLAGDGLPQAMTDHEQCLQTSACLCGQPRQQARLQVIALQPAERIQLPHCREAGYQTLVGIPVRLQQRLLGEIDLYFRQPQSLSADTQDLLTAMAGHLASAMESLRATALEREAAVAEERGLLARELHDSIAQSLAFLKIQVQLLRDAVVRGDTAARDRSLDELDAGVRGSYADVRELLLHFRTRTSDEDIEAALRATLSKFEHQTGITTALAMSGHGLPLASDVQIQVLHIVQEALSNVRKHARARHVALVVQRHPHWRFEVHDDGCGFDPRGVPPDSVHVGLGIMQERAQRIGARWQLRTHPHGAGTCVSIELPAQAGHPLESTAAP